MQASQVESNAAKTLLEKDSGMKCTLHYDTTQKFNRQRLANTDIYLFFSNGQEYHLRSLFFAYEDHDQILNLIFETYRRLALAISVVSNSKITANVYTLGKKLMYS